MPLILDDDRGLGAGSAAAASALPTGPAAPGFDLQAASTLFWRPVPILLRQADREEQQEELTFRILTGVARGNHAMRVLRIHISSEADLFFMHSLEVSEEDFQSLKSEQGILVDFASFPGKVITLLDKCTTPQPPGAPRFQAVLSVRGHESVFRIMETNDFKQLPHITLAFRPGNDAVVKQFLAFRLLEVKLDVEQLSAQLSKSQADHTDASRQLAEVRGQLAALREQYDKTVLEIQAEAKEQRAAAMEERAKERREVVAVHERDVAELRRRHQEALVQVQARVSELDRENRQLRDTKYELDTRVSELSHRLGTAEGTCRSLEDEAARLKASNAALLAEKADRDVLVNELKARLASTEEKAAAAVDMIEAQRGRVRDMEAGSRALEGRCGELKEALAGAEARARDAAAEVLKGNQIIEKLTLDLRMSREKAKRKQAILLRQEEELGARDAALAAAARDAAAASTASDALRSEVAAVKEENTELRSKLEESKQQLQSNEQMIRWLNQQVTEAQLGTAGGGLLPSSRYAPGSAYRPALPAPPPVTAASSAAALPPPAPSAPALQPPQAGAAATPAAGLLPVSAKYSMRSMYLPASPVSRATPAPLSSSSVTNTRYGGGYAPSAPDPAGVAPAVAVGPGLAATTVGVDAPALAPAAQSRFFQPR